VLYGLGAGHVPPGASISLVASITWDPEPNGTLGGDQAPDNVSATPPVLDDFVTLKVDGNNDGRPDNSHEPVGVDGADVPVSRLALLGNVPNPFNPTTTIRFVVPGAAGTATHVALDVFDLAGRRVATLVDGILPSGYRTAEWNGTSDGGAAVSSGVYFARVRASGDTETKKITLIR
jgi:hypothetical protein